MMNQVDKIKNGVLSQHIVYRGDETTESEQKHTEAMVFIADKIIEALSEAGLIKEWISVEDGTPPPINDWSDWVITDVCEARYNYQYQCWGDRNGHSLQPKYYQFIPTAPE